MELGWNYLQKTVWGYFGLILTFKDLKTGQTPPPGPSDSQIAFKPAKKLTQMADLKEFQKSTPKLNVGCSADILIYFEI